MSDLIPLVPPEVDLKDYDYFPVEFERLFASDTWVLGTPEEKIAGFHLWCKSWHQQPAGSLPDDDRMLAHLSSAGPRWKKLRAHAIRGWLKCTDGRLYHPFVAKLVLKAWKSKLESRTRTHNARVASLQKQIDAATGTKRDLLQAQMQALLQEPLFGVTATKRGEGKLGEGRLKTLADEPSAARGGAGKTVPTWQGYAEAYRQRWGVEPTRNRTVNGQLARFLERVPAEEAPQIAAFYVRSNRGLYVSAKHPVNLLLRDAEALRTEWLTGQQGTDKAARQADETATRGGAVHSLLEEKRKAAGA